MSKQSTKENRELAKRSNVNKFEMLFYELPIESQKKLYTVIESKNLSPTLLTPLEGQVLKTYITAKQIDTQYRFVYHV
ncbi:MAG: hypothetical protein PHP54_01710 [Clostridia bacterium]|nr:hypothetical protein [Clostridia bacterium]